LDNYGSRESINILKHLVSDTDHFHAGLRVCRGLQLQPAGEYSGKIPATHLYVGWCW